MDIQTVFYTMATIFMFLGILVFVSIIYFLWKVERSIHNFKKNTYERFHHFCDLKKGEVAAGVISHVLSKLKKHFQDKE